VKINIPNLDKVETGREPVPAGKYLVKITAGDVKATVAGDSKYIAWQGTIQEGESKGRILFWNTSLKENALWNLKGMLVAAKVDMAADGFATEDALGKNIYVLADLGEYNGKPKNEVKASYYPVS